MATGSTFFESPASRAKGGGGGIGGSKNGKTTTKYTKNCKTMSKIVENWNRVYVVF